MERKMAEGSRSSRLINDDGKGEFAELLVRGSIPTLKSIEVEAEVHWGCSSYTESRTTQSESRRNMKWSRLRWGELK